MNAQEILIQARSLIEHPTRWTQLAMARNAGGAKCPVTSPNACQWCSVGAVQAVAFRHGVSSALALSYLNTASPDEDAMSTNDRRFHKDVLDMYDLAIVKAAA